MHHREYDGLAVNNSDIEIIKERIETLKILELTTEGEAQEQAREMIAQLEDLLIILKIPKYVIYPTILN